jgi:hypothetical protein
MHEEGEQGEAERVDLADFVPIGDQEELDDVEVIVIRFNELCTGRRSVVWMVKELPCA